MCVKSMCACVLRACVHVCLNTQPGRVRWQQESSDLLHSGQVGEKYSLIFFVV